MIADLRLRRAANHESGHAFLSWLADREGVARIWRATDQYGETWEGGFDFHGELLPIVAVGGFVAECLFDDLDPIHSTLKIMAMWRDCDRIENEIDANPEAFPPPLELPPESLTPLCAYPSTSDGRFIPQDWAEREALVIEAADTLYACQELVIWFRDRLIENQSVHTDALTHLENEQRSKAGQSCGLQIARADVSPEPGNLTPATPELILS